MGGRGGSKRRERGQGRQVPRFQGLGAEHGERSCQALREAQDLVIKIRSSVLES